MGIELKKQAAKIVLTKRNLVSPPNAEIAFAIDISGSMQDEYRDGLVQEIAERILALGMNFDTDKKIDVWTFNRSSSYVGSCSEDKVDGFVKREILNNPKIDKWGGTSYTPVLKAIDSHYFGGIANNVKSFFGFGKKEAPASTAKAPVIVYFITDGSNDDKRDFEAIMKDFRSKNIYVQIVCVGNDDFSYVNRVADAEPNVGFCQIKDVKRISDEGMMEMLVSNEFVDWIKTF